MQPKETNTKIKGFLNKFPFQKVSIFLTVISFTYNVLLDRDLDCSCRDDSTDCNLYMALPFLTFFLLILWTDKVIPSSCTYFCKGKNKKEFVCGVIFIHIIKAAVVGGLWVVSVLMDGDWYVCCRNSEHPQLACKAKTNFTADEQVTISKLKNKSRNIGFGLLFTIVCLGFLMSLFNWRNCCQERSKCCDHYDKEVLYNEVILMESEDVLVEAVNNVAKKKMKEKFEEKCENKKFNECFDVVQNMIENREEQQPQSGNENTIPLNSSETRSSSGPPN